MNNLKSGNVLVLFLLAISVNFQSVFAQTSTADKSSANKNNYICNDSHFHLTNYVQEGTDIKKFLEIMGDKVGRSALFGIPLQQEWSFCNSGDFAPTYYLQSDAPLYYYSFTDAWIAMAYKSLTKEQQTRFDPMITGFNPADMYATAHIKRVLKTFPGVFSGIGEFSIHKEFVSSKISGGPASLMNPALDSIFEFAAQSGLLVVFHNDIDMPFAKKGSTPVYLGQAMDLFKRHPNTTLIWAHMGVGRVVQPTQGHMNLIEQMLTDANLKHVYFDISWDETAKYVISSPEAIKRVAEVINKFPDRFLFGTDEVAPNDQEKYLKVYNMYAPLFEQLTPEASEKLRKGNYERLFNAAAAKVRLWEKANIK